MSRFAEAYAEALQELTTAELPRIKLMRDLAKENPAEAPHVVKVLAAHARKCPPQHRLPALYLMDCILKSAEGDYPALLANVMGEVFAFIWDGATPDLRHKLVKTAGTWKDHLPASVMATVCAKMQPPASAAHSTYPVGPQQSLLFPTAGATPSSTVNPLVATTTALQSGPQLVLNVAGQPMVVSAGAAFPMAYPQQGVTHYHGGVLAPAPAAQPSSAATLSSSLIRLGQQLALQGPGLPGVAAVTGAKAAGSSGGSGGAPQVSTLALEHCSSGTVAGKHDETYSPSREGASTQHNNTAVLRNQQLSSLLAALLPKPSPTAGLSNSSALNNTAASAGTTSNAHTATHAACPRAMPPFNTTQPLWAGHPGLSGTVRGPVAILMQASHQAAVSALCAASEATRAKFRDLQFLRNRRKQTLAHQVRHWYSNVEEWLQGTRTVQEGALQVFDDQGSQLDNAEPVVHQVEEDPSQPFCAISGEVFDRTYDPDTDKWYYEDAMILTGDQAAAYGVMDGSIVKVHCLAGTPSVAPQAAVQTAQPAIPLNKGVGAQHQAPSVPLVAVKESQAPSVARSSLKDALSGPAHTSKRAQPEPDEETVHHPASTLPSTLTQAAKRIKVDG